METTSLCPTKIISDVPEDKDYFGHHNRVALALAELVRSEQGGKSIGLEGSWGSGKTTVVNLLRAELSKSSDFSIVPFDAWAYESDPLRRTFLESLNRHFISLSWINAKTWHKELDMLAQRTEVKITNTVPLKAALESNRSMKVLQKFSGIVNVDAKRCKTLKNQQHSFSHVSPCISFHARDGHNWGHTSKHARDLIRLITG